MIRYNELRMACAELFDQISRGYHRDPDNLTWFLEFFESRFPDAIGEGVDG